MIDSPGWEVPAYTVRAFTERRTRYALCIFVINEGERIRAQLPRIAPFADKLDLLIADGGSNDGSLEEDFLRTSRVRCLLTKTGPGGLSAQMRMAFAHCLREGYEGVVVMDGNNKDDPSAIPLFLEKLAAEYDHIQGSRYIPGGKAINTPFLRHWGVSLLHAPLISVAAGVRYTDTTNGFRAYSRRLLLDPRVQPFRDIFVGYELHYYLAIRAARLGFRVTEVPVARAYPTNEKPPTKISPVLGNFVILRTLLAACLHRYDPLATMEPSGNAKTNLNAPVK
jgi:dolichol-phosphate mannosyltransferase